ncbi:hypothetical protein H4I96_12163 [Botrytis cinerea]
MFPVSRNPTTRIAFRLQQNQKHVPSRVAFSKVKEHPSESSTQELPSAEIQGEEGTLRERTPFIEDNSVVGSPSVPPPPLLTLKTDASLVNNKAEFIFGSDSSNCDFLLDDKKTNGISGTHLRLYFSHDDDKSNREKIILQIKNQDSTRIFQENLIQFVNRPNINDPQLISGGSPSNEIETPQVPQRTWDWNAKEQLGGGGQGSVYKVKDKKTGEYFAAKIFGQHKYFKKELGYLKVLKHYSLTTRNTLLYGPERTRGERYGEKDDVWALGIVVLDMHYLLPASKPYWLIAKAGEPVYEEVWKKWMGDVKKIVEGLKGDGNGDGEMTGNKERGIQVLDVLRGMLMEEEKERLSAKDVIDLLSKSREAESKRKGTRTENLNLDVKRLRGEFHS